MVTGSQSQKGAIAAPERHYLPNCKQASLLTKTSCGSGQSTSTWEGALVVHPENRVAETRELINLSGCAHQTPHCLRYSDLGRAQNAGPTESVPLRTTWVPEPERLAVHGVAKSQTQLSDFTFTVMHWRRKWQSTPVFLPGESQGRGSLVGDRLWGHTESDATEVT